jgi:hypothetical protein
MRRSTALLAALACLALNGCGDSGSAKLLPAPEVTLTSAEQELWAKLPPDRSAIPVLLYHARVTSDQHQSGHGSTTGRVRRRAGSVSV